jgi:hypothetical protein
MDSLVDGTLTIEVRMRRNDQQTNTLLAPFIPENPLYKNILKKFMDEESADVIFAVGSGSQPGRDSCKKAKITPAKFYAHRLVLQDGAPILSELCKPSGGILTAVPVTDVKPDIFRHMLYYMYGGKLSDEELKESAKDLIDASNKYGAVSLKLEAEAYYVKSTKLTIDNILDNLLYADSKNCALLKEAAMDFLVENWNAAINKVSFDDVPGSMMKDLLAAMARGKKEDNGGSDDDPIGFNTMRVGTLRKMLHEKGLDVDGSREAMIALLKENS